MLILTLKCNRKCQFCFQNHIRDNSKNINIKDFNKFLSWCNKHNSKDITLTGGEPTSHPLFKNIILNLIKNNFRISLITNLVFDTKLVEILCNKNIKEILINFDNPKNYSKNEFKVFTNNLERFSKSDIDLTFSYTMINTNQEFYYVIKYSKKFGIKRVRFDISRPSSKTSNKFIYTKDFPKFKDKILEIIEKLEKENITFKFDCPMPKCLFSEKEIKKYSLYKKGLNHNKCGNILVNYNLTMTSCPFYKTKGQKIIDFENEKKLKEYIKKNITNNYLLYNTFPFKACKKCNERINKLCTGGCIAERYNSLSENNK